MKNEDKLLKQGFKHKLSSQKTDIRWQDIESQLAVGKTDKGKWFNGLVYVLSISLVVFLMLIRVQPVKLRQQFTILVEMSLDQDRESDILYKSAPYMFKRRKL